MEGIAFILIGGALFSQSWHVLGLYADGRTSGLFALALALAALLVIPMDPMLFLGSAGSAQEVLASHTILEALVIAWAVYGVGVGAQSLWDFDERAIGFTGVIVTAVSVVAFFYYAVILDDDTVMLAMSAGTLILSVIGSLVFFYLAIPFMVLRLVTGWVMLAGSIGLMAIGLAVITTVVELG